MTPEECNLIVDAHENLLKMAVKIVNLARSEGSGYSDADMFQAIFLAVDRKDNDAIKLILTNAIVCEAFQEIDLRNLDDAFNEIVANQEGFNE